MPIFRVTLLGLFLMTSVLGVVDSVATTQEVVFPSMSSIVADLQDHLRSILKQAKRTEASARRIREVRVAYDESRRLFVVSLEMAEPGEKHSQEAIEATFGCKEWEGCWMLDSFGSGPSDFELRANYRSGLQAVVRGGEIQPSDSIPPSTLLDEFPVPIYQPKPKYPEGMKGLGVGGTVVLNTLVGSDGAVKELRVIKSAVALLDSAALQAVRAWRFRPAQLSTKPVPAWVTIPVRFSPDRE